MPSVANTSDKQILIYFFPLSPMLFNDFSVVLQIRIFMFILKMRK